MPAEAPASVLFACTLNRTRSPMAAALMRQMFGDRIHVDSCGIKADAGFDPFMIQVLQEVGAEVASHGPKRFEQLDDDSFDLVISLTPDAQHRAAQVLRGRSVEIEYWPTYDPTDCEGSRELVLDAYRLLRDHLHKRIFERFAQPST
jgi:protein-tyrosine-phosphatase